MYCRNPAKTVPVKVILYTAAYIHTYIHTYI